MVSISQAQFGEKDPLAQALGTPKTQQAAFAGSVNKPTTKPQPELNESNSVSLQFAGEVGHGSGCGHCVGMNPSLMSGAKKGRISKKALFGAMQARQNEVIAHENAHKMRAGQFGGAINYKYNRFGYIVGGSVPIQMPSFSGKNPQQTVAHARQVIDAALAPAEPSGPDRAIAARASQILFAAQAKVGQQAGKPGGPNNPGQSPASNPFQIS